MRRGNHDEWDRQASCPLKGGPAAWNTVGAILGSLAAGFVLIPALRYEGAIQVAVYASALLGVAAEMGLAGGCLLGEMPHVFAQLPFPAASLGVLRVFGKLAKIEIDLAELAQQAEAMGHRLGEVLVEIERRIAEQGEAAEAEESFEPPAEEPRVSPADERRIDDLFEKKKARADRSKAYELKGELDRLEVFDLYEDRFLDLFKKEAS